MPNTVEATIIRSTGPAFVERNGVKVSLKEGDAIYESDLIITGSETTIDISFRDGTKSRIGPDSEMRLVDFEFGENEDASFVVNLTQGAMRTVTGEIVKLNPEAFEVITPRATAGIRGTEFITEVNGDSERHLVLYISGGSVMLVKNENGQSLSFDKPLQGTSINADGSMQARSYSMNEMQSLINDIAPSIGGNIPTNPDAQGDWADANNLTHAKSSDSMAGIEVSIVYDDAVALETVLVALQENSGIIVNSVTASSEIANQNLEDITLLETPNITNTFIDENVLGNNSIFNSESIFASLGGNHANLGSHNNTEPSIKPENKPNGNDYGSFTENINQGQTAPVGGAGDDRYIYNSMQGTLNAGDGNNSIAITTLENSLSEVITGSGNDTIHIGSYTGGDITTGAGNDTIHIKSANANNGDTINTGAGNDILFIKATGSAAGWIDNKIDMGSGYDVIVHTGTLNNISNQSGYEAAINDKTGILNSVSDLKNNGITITDNGIILDFSIWQMTSIGQYTNSSNTITITGDNISTSASLAYSETINQQAVSFT